MKPVHKNVLPCSFLHPLKDTYITDEGRKLKYHLHEVTFTDTDT